MQSQRAPPRVSNSRSTSRYDVTIRPDFSTQNFRRRPAHEDLTFVLKTTCPQRTESPLWSFYFKIAFPHWPYPSQRGNQRSSGVDLFHLSRRPLQGFLRRCALDRPGEHVHNDKFREHFRCLLLWRASVTDQSRILDRIPEYNAFGVTCPDWVVIPFLGGRD